MKHLLFIVCLLSVLNVSAQSDKKDPVVFRYVEVVPKANYDLGQYLSENLHYPDTARVHNIEGRVVIKFIVNEDGHISDCTVVTGIGGGCDEEGLRVVKSLPPWVPGEQDGKKVKVYFTLPIAFKLTD